MRASSRALGALAICAAAALWGLDGVVLTPRLYELSVPFVVFLLHAVPFALMQPVLFPAYGVLRRMGAREWLVLALVAASGGMLGTLAIVKALFLVGFNQLSVVVLLQKLQPVFAIGLAAVLLGERVTWRLGSLAAVALAGAYLLAFGLRLPEPGAGSAGTAAALWAVLAAAAYGSATVFGKRLLSRLDFRQATFGRYGLTALFALAYLVVSGEGVPLGAVTSRQWLIVLLIGVTTGSGSIFLYYYGLARVRAVVSAICELCLPLSALLFDHLVNASRLGAWQWVGAALLTWAIARVSLEEARRRA